MVPLSVARRLTDDGYDVIRVSEVGLARADDSEILDYAINEKRVLVTLDEDFGDWVILPLKEHPGVIRVKVAKTTGDNIIKVLVPLLNANRDKDFANYLVIASLSRVKWVKTA